MIIANQWQGVATVNNQRIIKEIDGG